MTDERVVSDPVPRFVTASPLIEVRRLADLELKNTASPAQIIWLNDHLLLWLRVLNRIRADIEIHIAEDRRNLAVLKPSAALRVSDDYLAAKAEFDQRTRRRLHFHRIVKTRIEEVKAKLGSGPLYGWVTTGDLVDILASIAAHVDAGDMQAAGDKAWYWADRFAAQLLAEADHADTSEGLDADD